MSKFLSWLFSDSLSVAAYLAGVYCIATAAGIAKGVKVSNLSLPSPRSKPGKVLMYVAGLSLIGFGVYRVYEFPEYRSAVFEESVYHGTEAKQIVADGEDVYLLTQNGNIHRITQKGVSLVDDGTGTQQIAAAGGALYILKDDGRIFAYQPIQARADRSQFMMVDEARLTKQILVTGDTLYVLKVNGNIWRTTIPPDPNKQDSGTTKKEFIQVDIGEDTKEITSSGSILYILKTKGTIWKYAPTLGQSLEEIYDKGDADSIKADGGALYFVRKDRTPCKYQEPFVEKNSPSGIGNKALPKPQPSGAGIGGDRCKVITKTVGAKSIDALGGVVYILTTENKIVRYSAETDTERELTEAHADNKIIAAYFQDLFVIKKDGSVKRYNEGREKR
jgi:hypothetical protein